MVDSVEFGMWVLPVLPGTCVVVRRSAAREAARVLGQGKRQDMDAGKAAAAAEEWSLQARSRRRAAHAHTSHFRQRAAARASRPQLRFQALDSHSTPPHPTALQPTRSCHRGRSGLITSPGTVICQRIVFSIVVSRSGPEHRSKAMCIRTNYEQPGLDNSFSPLIFVHFSI
ncbi:hypothetical protein ANO11243_038270 [Dothideomycetidae sp. 11243]|nr:hypothetical protein ANO11243_038270 [fungal sp. No.11243]